MEFIEHSGDPQIFNRVMVGSSLGRTRLVAYVKKGVIEAKGFEVVANSLKSFMKENNIGSALYGLVVSSDTLTDDQVRQQVSNWLGWSSFGCIWAIVASQQKQRFFACHNRMRCPVSTDLFEDQMDQLVQRGFDGVAERKRHNLLFEIAIHVNLILLFSTYRPGMVLNDIRHKYGQ